MADATKVMNFKTHHRMQNAEPLANLHPGLTPNPTKCPPPTGVGNSRDGSAHASTLYHPVGPRLFFEEAPITALISDSV